MNQLHLATIERSFLAILAGFATMAVLVTLATMAITRSLPRMIGEPDRPRRRYLLLNLTYSAAFAVSGGYVTAIVAKADPLRNVLMLAIVILLLSALSALATSRQAASLIPARPDRHYAGRRARRGLAPNARSRLPMAAVILV